MPLLEIAIIFRNEQAALPACLDSLKKAMQQAQYWPTLILIDNASNDLSLASAQGFLGQNPQIRGLILSRSQNHLAEARNDALRLAQAKWLCFIDADCRATPPWIDRILQQVKMNSSFGSIGGASPYFGSGYLPTLANLLQGVFAQTRNSVNDLDHLPTCNLVVSTHRARQVGGFNPNFRYVGEDLEFSLRMKSQGFQIGYDNKMQINHQLNPSLLKWVRKMFKYGSAQVMVYYSASNNFPFYRLIPGVSVLFTLFIFVFFTRIGIFALALALLLSVIWAFLQSKKILLSLLFAPFFALSLWSYGLGEIWALLRIVFDGRLSHLKRAFLINPGPPIKPAK